MKAFLFDIDYTLLRSGGLGKITVNQAFLEVFGRGDVWKQMNSAGKTDRAVFQEIAQRELGRSMNAAEEQAVRAAYIRAYKIAIADSPRFEVLPGVYDLLSKLSLNPELVLAIQTGNVHEVAWLKLEKGGLAEFFRIGGYGGDVMSKVDVVRSTLDAVIGERADLTTPQCFVIGDSPFDITAGKKNSCRTVGVCTGSASRDSLREAGADCILDSLAEVQSLCEFTEIC